MTQVWMIRNSDTDIHLFNRREHLRESVEISYSRCQDVVITEQSDVRRLSFMITGKRKGTDFNHEIIAECFSVWTEPCHL